MKSAQKYIIRGCKPIVIKYLALLIGICYLANPLQHEISGVFHEISHLFEAPHTPIDHSNMASEENVEHYYHEHEHADHSHEHTIIDMLDSIFNAANDDGQEESLLVDFKVDKHITIEKYPLKKIYSFTKKPYFISEENKIIKGYSRLLDEPPQSFSL